MGTHRGQTLIVTLIMTIALAGMATTGTAQETDPNIVESFAASWESGTLAVTMYNPIETPDIDPLTRKNVVAVSGQVYILDTNNLVAVSTTNPAALQAFDQDGLAVVFDPNLPEPNLARIWQLGEQSQTYCVELHLDPNQAIPTSLSQLDFTVDALYGQTFSTVDMAPVVSEDWIELAPGYRMRIEEADIVDDFCTIMITAEATDVSHASNNLSFDPNETWDENTRRGRIETISNFDIIAHTEIIDTAETPSWSGDRSSGSGGSIHDGECEMTWTFQFENCTGLENLLIRHWLVAHPYEVAIPLTVTNVTIPAP